METLNAGDTAWVLIATGLVTMMTPALAFFYGGMVRKKNILSTLNLSFITMGLISLQWVLIGYTLAFGPSIGGLIGALDHLGLNGIGAAPNADYSTTIPGLAFAAFQMTFAVITPALITGAFVERVNFKAYLVFALLWATLVYDPLAHSVWAVGGLLRESGALDFAGGTVVHITAGVAALVAALVMGNRSGFPTTPMPPHNMTMTVTGAGMLWVGWFGFNAGSALAANGNATMAMLVTHISAAAGSLAWMTIEWIKFRKPSVLGIVTGMVAGLGTITPASGYVGPGGALIIGLCAGVVCFFMTQLIKRVWKIDDSLDVFPVHGVGGVLGTILAGIFASTELGVFSGQGFAEGINSIGEQLGVQFIGVIVTFVYTAVVTYILLKITGVLTAGLRVTKEEEMVGLDISLHEEDGYKML